MSEQVTTSHVTAKSEDQIILDHVHPSDDVTALVHKLHHESAFLLHLATLIDPESDLDDDDIKELVDNIVNAYTCMSNSRSDV
jgi:hypothetical protein